MLQIPVNKGKVAQVRGDEGAVLLEYDFGVSRYGTLAEKVRSISKGQSLWGKIYSYVINLQYSINGG